MDFYFLICGFLVALTCSPNTWGLDINAGSEEEVIGGLGDEQVVAEAEDNAGDGEDNTGDAEDNAGDGGSSLDELAEQFSKWAEEFSTTWPRYERTTEILKGMKRALPQNIELYSIGQTVEGREIWVIKLGSNVRQPRAHLVTPIKLVANMHGDETLGRAMLHILATDIIGKYLAGDERAVNLLSNTEIHLLPSLNADGFEAAPEGECDPDPDAVGRVNANQIDLNRNFPDQYEKLEHPRTFDEMLEGREPETVAIMKWITTNYFVLSINLHALTVVASYPYDSVPPEVSADPKYKDHGVISYTPDHEVFFALATLYSTNHGFMSKGHNCTVDPTQFENGVVNGAEWYNVKGGMQDVNYKYANTFEITVELSCCKFPRAETLLEEWENNREALWKYMEASHWGIMGMVFDPEGNPVEGATILVEGIEKPIATTPWGEYWRLLLPGTYVVSAEADGYETFAQSVTVDEGEDVQKRVDFKLEPIDQ